MKNRQQILRAHYAALLRKVATWAGLIVLGLATMLPGVASAAGQLTTRSALVGSSAGGATTTYAVSFKTAASASSIGSYLFEICDSPLATTSCAASASSSVNSNGASIVGTQATTTLSCSGCGNIGTATLTKGATTGPGTSGTSVKYAYASTQTQTGNNQLTLNFTGVINPLGNNQQYYLRVSTFSDTAYTTQVDFGAIALSTARQITVSANVQESLVFCTGTSGANCGTITGNTVNVGTGTDNVVSTTASGGTSLMHVTTNAASGYVLTYTAADFASGANIFGAASNQTIATCASGSTNGDCFGVNLKANTTPSISGSADVTGTAGFAAPTISTGYGTANTFKFVSGSAQQVAQVAGPTVQTDYTVSYAGVAGTTTKPGAYSTTFTWICTGTF